MKIPGRSWVRVRDVVNWPQRSRLYSLLVGMGRVQISYGLGGSVGRCKVLCDLKDGVPRGSESAERPPLLVLEEQRLASKVIDVEAT